MTRDSDTPFEWRREISAGFPKDMALSFAQMERAALEGEKRELEERGTYQGEPAGSEKVDIIYKLKREISDWRDLIEELESELRPFPEANSQAAPKPAKVNGCKISIRGDLKELAAMLRKLEDAGRNDTESKTTVRPAYIQELIDKGILYPDGRRVQQRLLDVIAFLHNEKRMELTVKYIQENFLKDDGKPYSEKTIRNALEIGKAK